MKKERPILFSTDMVKANMEGRKTQTRRIVVPQPVKPYKEHMKEQWSCLEMGGDWKCPYGKPGDLLYVRESWKLTGFWMEDGELRISYADGNDMIVGYDFDLQDWVVNQWEKLVRKGIIVPSNDPEDGEYERMEFAEGVKHPFSPSIHLPKWCSRIWLEVVDVRVERIQDISYDDAIAEGIEESHGGWFRIPGSEIHRSSPGAAFSGLWQQINGPESWDANPWVWVIKYKVMSTTGRPDGI